MQGLPERIQQIAVFAAQVDETLARADDPPAQGYALEYQIGKADGTVLARSERAPKTSLAGGLGYANVLEGNERWRSLILESGDRTYRVQIAESIPPDRPSTTPGKRLRVT